MSIQKIIRFNLILVAFLLLLIFISNYIALKKIEENNNNRYDISRIVFLQDVMSSLIFDALIVKNINELDLIKLKFEREQNKFEIINLLLNQRDNTLNFLFEKNIFNHKLIKEDFDTLLINKNIIIKNFDKMQKLQKRKLSFSENFAKKYVLEKNLRENIEAKIQRTNNDSWMKAFADIRYYSKEALFQYQDDKHLTQWLDKTKELQEKTNIKTLDEYISLIETFTVDILEIKEIKNNENILFTKLKSIRLQNQNLNIKINNNIEKLTRKLTSTIDTFLFGLILFVIAIISLVSFKVHFTVSSSVDEIKGKISDEIDKNRQKDEVLAQQSKLAAMGEMMGNIAHQWRQPLNAIAANIQMTDMDYEDGLVDEKYFQTFIKENMVLINFMSNTINDFRDFFKSDKQRAKFRILEAIKKPINILKPQLKELDIKISLEGDDFTIISLQSEFQQVILNIISNAKDALESNNIANGYIKVRTEVFDATGVIIIEDNAKGIPEDVIKRIFEPYYTTKEQGKGTGIGLYISNEIIRKHMKSKIDVSNTSEGARFEIKLNLIELSSYEIDHSEI